MNAVIERPVSTPADDRHQPHATRAHLGRLRRLSGWFAATAVVAAVTWVLVISVTRGRALQRAHPEVFLGAAPLVGRDEHDGWHWRFGIGLVVAGAIAAIVMLAVWTGWTQRARLRNVVLGASVSAIGFALSLALTDGADGVLNGARHRTEYLSNLPNIHNAATFVRTFIDRIDQYSVHVRGHPPGFVLVLKLLEVIGLDGAVPAAALSVLAVGVLVAAVLTTVRTIAGDEWVRRCAPFMVVVPYALWQVTSADACYTAVGALAVACLALACKRHGVAALRFGVLGGLLLGALIYFTYLGLLFAVVPLPFLAVHLLRRRRPRRDAWLVLIGATVGVAAVVIGFLVAGFWWVDGARRTRTEYWEGTAQFRDWAYFKYANIAVAAIAIGPAAIAGMVRLRDRRMWLLVGGGLAAMTASHFSQYTRGEVERIWLLFFPWLVIAAGALAARASRRSATAWLGLQAACAIALQAALVSKW